MGGDGRYKAIQHKERELPSDWGCLDDKNGCSSLSQQKKMDASLVAITTQAM